MRSYAQILNGKVHWIFESDKVPEFAADIEIIDITDLTQQPKEGWLYDPQSGFFIEPSQTASVTEVSRAQAKTALFDAGLLDDVEAYLNSENADRRMLIAWQDAQTFTRFSPFITAMQQILQLDDATVDELFLKASEVQL